jgi:hypothetical protein
MIIFQGCASYLPVPGGDKTTNQDFYQTEEHFLKALDRLSRGMPERKVLNVLERKKGDFLKLDRSEIVEVLYGGSDVEMQHGIETKQPSNHLLQSLYGYKFTFKVIEHTHGFSSPIRIRTNETGYSYIVYLIFRDNKLFERPVVSGGNVNNTSSGTLFDYLTPSTVMKHAVE